MTGFGHSKSGLLPHPALKKIPALRRSDFGLSLLVILSSNNPRGSQEEQSSRYPPSGVTSQTSLRPSTPGSSSSYGLNVQIPSDQPESLSHGKASPTEAANIIGLLKNKSVDELRKLSSDKDAYSQFLLSLEVVKLQNTLRDELRKETVKIAKANLEKEPHILELKNQCRVIRTSELAAAQDKLYALEIQKEECLRAFSPLMLLQKLQETMNKAEEESENLQRQLQEREIEPADFVQKCKRLRTAYQRQALIQLAVKTSASG